MSKFSLLWRSLTFHWRTNLAVLLGCAVGAAVLTGALLVGDSMRGSLRDLTMQRLGQIDEIAVSPNFFAQGLGERFSEQAKPIQAAEAILVGASVTGPDNSVAPAVNVIGTTAGFWKMFNIPSNGELASEALVNRGLADKLHLKVGDRLRVSLQTQADVPREGLLGERDSEKVLRQIPVTIAGIVPDDGGGRFALQNSQTVPMNLFLPIEQLADALGQPGRANALLVHTGTNDSAETNSLTSTLDQAMSLEDFGLEIHADPQLGYVRIESRRKILDERLVHKIEQSAVSLNAVSQPVLAYLANTIAKGDQRVPYSIVTAIAPVDAPPLGPIGPPAEQWGLEQIVLNSWTAEQLKAEPGDEIDLYYFVVDDAGQEHERQAKFKLASVVPMEGVAIDRHFTPEYAGITDADSFTDWDPPFPFDQNRVRPVDEDYWDDYRTAPKAFVTLQAGQKLWSTRYGNVTSVRIAPPSGTAVANFVLQLTDELLKVLVPEDVELVLQPVREQALQASSGSTDFGQLFIGFSMFLIASAAMLVGLLFRLNIERRASQIGLMLAVGLRIRQVRQLLLGEGVALAALGSALGLGGASWYAQQMIGALNTDWQAAVGSPFLRFHWTIESLLIGYVSSVVVALLAIWWGIGRLGKVAVPRLLHRGFTFASTSPSGRGWLSLTLAVIGLAGGTVLVAVALTMAEDSVGAFFGGGALLLVGALALLSVLLRSSRGNLTGAGSMALTKLGIRNGGRYPARSILTAGLLGFATFIVVAIGAMRHGEQKLLPDFSSGNGGYSLIAETTIPLHLHLDAADAAFKLNLSDETEKMLPHVVTHHLRMRPGDEASCLNVYRPDKPTLLGVNEWFIDRGGFAFQALLNPTAEQAENPWTMLLQETEEGVIPAIGDAAALQWIMHKQLGDEIELIDDRGRPVRLRVVASLSGSIFQGELLISEDNMLKYFPSVSGYRYLLFEMPVEQTEKLASHLETDLADYGLAAQTTWDRIAAYKAVENTYMGSFQTLGGFGLILGTLGLGTVLFRNVMERRGELGLMRALGFRKASLAWLVLAENLFLLVCGVLIGTACAFVAVLPQLRRLHDIGPILSLGQTLLLVLLAGILSGLVAVIAAMRTPLITALRSE